MDTAGFFDVHYLLRKCTKMILFLLAALYMEVMDSTNWASGSRDTAKIFVSEQARVILYKSEGDSDRCFGNEGFPANAVEEYIVLGYKILEYIWFWSGRTTASYEILLHVLTKNIPETNFIPFPASVKS